MAKLAEAVDEKDLTEHLSEVMSKLAITTQPVVICGVQRKANIGNFENVDIYCAVALPVTLADDEKFDIDKLNEKLVATAEYGFHLTSSETLARFQVVKGASSSK